MTLSLTMAMSEYDHVRDLASGTVRVEGVELTALALPVEEIFYRFLRYREWHVSELSFAKYVALRAAGDDTIRAIPVFPSRVCRHSSIYVRPDGPRDPAQLAGARIGLPEWAQTAAVYTRSLLTNEWGIPLRDVHWVQAGVNEPGRREKVQLHLPEGVRLTQEPDRSLDEMLHAGDLDAVFSAHPPASFERGDPGITRLFPDYEPVEREYVTRTGIFPIMHVVAIRADVLDRDPWVAQNLFTAFTAAKDASLARLAEMTASRVPLPWAPGRLAEMTRLIGPDPWPYGVEANRLTLDAFTRYAHEQGVAARRLEPEDLFVPEVLGRYRVLLAPAARRRWRRKEDPMSPTKQDRRELAAATRMLVDAGILGYSGHLSIRCGDGRRLLIQPVDDARAELHPDRLLVVTLDGDVVEGDGRPPSELAIHTEIYRARPDVGAVAHFHHDPTTVFTVAGDHAIVPVKNHASRWSAGVPVHQDPSHIATAEQGRALAATLGGCHAALLRSHGEVVVAEDIRTLFADVVHFVENATLLAKALTLGPVRPLSEAECARFDATFRRDRHARKLWIYYTTVAAAAGRLPGGWENGHVADG